MTEQESTKIISLLEKSVRYTPIVYRQSLYTSNQYQFDNNFILEFKHTDLPDDSLLFFVPTVSSVQAASEDKRCKLTIRIPYLDSTGTYRFHDDVYDILVEENDSTMRYAGKGDIVAYRMCIFRFQKSNNRAILCNSPLYDDAIFSKLKVTDCEFVNKPTFVDPENPDVSYTLVSSKEFEDLVERVTKLERKIIFGTGDPEEALKDYPAGTIYIQHEED